ncbi:hypothetical protein FHS38_006636 [Streptomyces netropsis]|uniref:Secreted protein n=1 Tax=Streptomyces netropsis TaxID=55404 RepID=A0A7W7LJ51_STRNE|nr:hypothetical protein [Streptomyces netropsis]
MRRGIMQVLLWALATAAAMAVSWYGVRTVLAGTAYEPPRALPISGAAAPTAGESASSTRGPEPPVSPSRPATTAPSATRVTPTPTREAARRPDAQPPSGATEVKSYAVRGGRAVFDLGENSATLVSATPDEGWQMRVWKQSAWIRVDFVAGTKTTSVFVTWNGHPPQVQTVES